MFGHVMNATHMNSFVTSLYRETCVYRETCIEGNVPKSLWGDDLDLIFFCICFFSTPNKMSTSTESAGHLH